MEQVQGKKGFMDYIDLFSWKYFVFFLNQPGSTPALVKYRESINVNCFMNYPIKALLGLFYLE